jgi:hypothetical protein
MQLALAILFNAVFETVIAKLPKAIKIDWVRGVMGLG